MPTETWAAGCEDLVKTYRTATGEVRALRGVTARFPDRAVTAVVGPSGSGKSSLLRLLAGIDRPTSGRVRIGDVELSSASARALRRLRRRMVGYVFQRPSDNLFPHLTVGEHLDLARRSGGRQLMAVTDALEALGIAHRIGHRPVQLSGGEQQRAAFAQVLVGGARLIVADEPTAELDGASARGLLAAVRALASLGVTFVIATHDRDVVRAADAALELEHGSVTGGHSDAEQLAEEMSVEPTEPAADVVEAPIVLAARQVSKTYRRGDEEVRALRDVDLTLREAQFVALVGRSGSGKTTLLNLIAGWEPPDDGTILWRGQRALPSLPPWSELAVLPQKLGLLEELSVRENVELPARLAGRLPEFRARVSELLERFGLTELESRPPTQTSVGEQQRAALARALILSPALLLADEPTGHQDRSWAGAVLDALRTAAWSGVACLAATHAEEIAGFADRTLLMSDGRIVDRPSAA